MHACKASTELKSMDAIVSVCARCVLRKQTEPGWHHACMVQRETQLLWSRRFDPALMRPAPRPSPTPSSCATVGKQKRSTEFPFPVSLTSFFGLFLAITGETLIIYLYFGFLSKKIFILSHVRFDAKCNRRALSRCYFTCMMMHMVILCTGKKGKHGRQMQSQSQSFVPN